MSLQRHKPNLLHHHVSPGIGQHFFFDPVASRHAHVGQFVDRHSWFYGKVPEGTMAFLFREELTTVGDNQTEVAGASLVHAGKVDFIKDAMTQREPNPAVEVQGSSDAGLGARSPARFNSGPARRVLYAIAQCQGPRSGSSPPCKFARK